MPKIFRFSVDGEELFHYVLQSEQCQGNAATTNQRCKRKCIIGYEYCFSHMKSVKHLTIRQSSIPNSGQGLFACDPTKGINEIVFKRGAKICDYNGIHLNQRTLDEQYGDHTAPYGVEACKNHIIDSAGRRGIGSLANHKPRSQINADIKSNTNLHTVILRAIKPIRNNQEIFINYGRLYDLGEEGVEYSTKAYYPR